MLLITPQEQLWRAMNDAEKQQAQRFQQLEYIESRRCHFCRQLGHVIGTCPVLQQRKCQACGRNGHFVNRCFNTAALRRFAAGLVTPLPISGAGTVSAPSAFGVDAQPGAGRGVNHRGNFQRPYNKDRTRHVPTVKPFVPRERERGHGAVAVANGVDNPARAVADGVVTKKDADVRHEPLPQAYVQAHPQEAQRILEKSKVWPRPLLVPAVVAANASANANANAL
jgi:hypothetical protein